MTTRTHEADVVVVGGARGFFQLMCEGVWAGYLPPGTWTSLGFALRSACGRIHWAGTETAEVWNGYMDGAISSGERAARDVLAAGVQTLPAETAATDAAPPGESE